MGQILKEFLSKPAPTEAPDLSPEVMAYLCQPCDQLFVQPYLKGDTFTVADVATIAKIVKETTGAEPVSFSEFEVTFQTDQIDRMKGFGGSLSLMVELRAAFASALSVRSLTSNMRPLEEC